MTFSEKQIAQIESIKLSMKKEEPNMTDRQALDYALEFASEILGAAYWLSSQSRHKDALPSVPLAGTKSVLN